MNKISVLRSIAKNCDSKDFHISNEQLNSDIKISNDQFNSKDLLDMSKPKKMFSKQPQLVDKIYFNDNIYEFILNNIDSINLRHIYTNSETIFHIIASRGLDEILDLIKEKFKKKDVQSIIEHKNDTNLTALHEAACYGYKEICETLIHLGANINVLSLNKNTPIHFAIVNGHVETVRLFINKNSKLDIENNVGKTPYKLLFKHMKELIKDILDKKKKYLARVSLSNKNGKIKMITNEELIYDRTSQKISFSPSYGNKPKYCCCSSKNKNFGKVIPETRTNNADFCRRNSKEKDLGTSKLSRCKHIKDKRILVQYDYTEISDSDVEKFVIKEKKEIVTHPWFQTLMDFYWTSFGKKLFIIQLVIYLSYTAFFTLSSILYSYNLNPNYNSTSKSEYIDNSSMEDNIKSNENNYDFENFYTNSHIHTVVIILDTITFLMNTFYFVNEITEIKKQRKKHAKFYFTNKWNLFDIIQITLIYVTIPLKMINHKYILIPIAILYPIFFIKFLNFSRGFRNVGPIVRTIFKMLKDIYNFMAVLFLFIMGFSQAFFVLMNHDTQFSNPIVSVLTTFDMVIGGFDSSSLNQSEYPITCNVLYRLYLIISVIMLLNILIAILENSYVNISSEAENEWKLERAKLIISLMDNNLLLFGNKHITVENIDILRSLEIDNKPVKGIENLKLE